MATHAHQLCTEWLSSWAQAKQHLLLEQGFCHLLLREAMRKLQHCLVKVAEWAYVSEGWGEGSQVSDDSGRHQHISCQVDVGLAQVERSLLPSAAQPCSQSFSLPPVHLHLLPFDCFLLGATIQSCTTAITVIVFLRRVSLAKQLKAFYNFH